ncbi:MAG: hypothetical protein EOO10_22570 [Chitinophagaceae bacterium]|nr:MAG: hypothetical protein EOO10_22570 [Chitinophagaceae bacterium]
MKTTFTILAGIGAITVAAAVVMIARGFNQGRRLSHVSNEGYETAHDILYPNKKSRTPRLHFGPVLPQD